MIWQLHFCAHTEARPLRGVCVLAVFMEALFMEDERRNHPSAPQWMKRKWCTHAMNYFLRFYLFIFRERGRKGERAGGKHHCVFAIHVPPTGGPACKPDTCPGWESNRQPFGLQPMLNPLSHTSQGYAMNYYSAFKRKEILTPRTMWMKLEDIRPSEISQSQKDK